MSVPESGPREDGGQGKVQKVHLPGMGTNWPRGEESGAMCSWGQDKGTWSSVALITKMERLRVGQ